MAFLDKLTELAQNVGDKANDALEMSKLATRQRNEEKTLAELKIQLGELYLASIRASGEVPEQARALVEKVEEVQRTLAEITAEIDAKRAVEAASRAGAPSYDSVRCPSCGQENPPGTKFCAHCGTKLEQADGKKFCTRCGAALTAGTKYCSACGAPQN